MRRRCGAGLGIALEFQPDIIVFKAVAVAGRPGRPQADVDLVPARFQVRAGKVEVSVSPGPVCAQAHHGVEAVVGHIKSVGRIRYGRGIDAVGGAGDRRGLDRPVNGQDAGRAVFGGECYVQARLVPCRRRL